MRSRLRRLAKLYKNVEEAEIAHGLLVSTYLGEEDGLFNRNVLDKTAHHDPERRDDKITKRNDPGKSVIETEFDRLLEDDPEEAQAILNKLMTKMLHKHGFIYTPKEVINCTIDAMKTLAQAGKEPFIVHRFAQCIAQKRANSCQSLMPLDRMPFGLIEYQINFFTASDCRQVIEIEMHESNKLSKTLTISNMFF